MQNELNPVEAVETAADSVVTQPVAVDASTPEPALEPLQQPVLQMMSIEDAAAIIGGTVQIIAPVLGGSVERAIAATRIDLIRATEAAIKLRDAEQVERRSFGNRVVKLKYAAAAVLATLVLLPFFSTTRVVEVAAKSDSAAVATQPAEQAKAEAEQAKSAQARKDAEFTADFLVACSTALEAHDATWFKWTGLRTSFEDTLLEQLSFLSTSGISEDKKQLFETYKAAVAAKDKAAIERTQFLMVAMLK